MNHSYREINKNYTLWLDTLGFSSAVVYEYNFRVRDFFEWLNMRGVVQITELNQKLINEYFSYLETRPNKRKAGYLLSSSHLNHNFIAVDKLLEFLHIQGVRNAPAPTGRRVHVCTQERIQKIEILSTEEIKDLIKSISNTYKNLSFEEREQRHYQLKLIFALNYACGLRLSEGVKVQIKDIDFDRKTVFVEQGKNYKDRFIPMSTGVYTALQDYIYNFRNLQKPPHNKLFLKSKNELNKMLKHLQNECENEQIKQKRLSMHILRHSIATHLLQNGMSIENISLFLGHSSLESTQIYTHLAEN
jgi:integrase/recombinase XerD